MSGGSAIAMASASNRPRSAAVTPSVATSLLPSSRMIMSAGALGSSTNVAFVDFGAAAAIRDRSDDDSPATRTRRFGVANVDAGFRSALVVGAVVAPVLPLGVFFSVLGGLTA